MDDRELFIKLMEQATEAQRRKAFAILTGQEPLAAAPNE